MSKPPTKYGVNTQLEDSFHDFLEGAATFLLWAGLLAVVSSTGFLLFTYFTFSGGQTTASPDQAFFNIGIFSKLLIAGMVAVGVGSTFLFWGEETLSAFQLIGAGLFYFAPLLVPALNGQTDANLPVPAASALATIQSGGMAFAAIAIVVLIADIAMRIRLRSVQGTKADQLKYGKGIRQEQDVRNVFMGKCWQLPFCRKFVRERCPIFHSKRTCWKELVGCMCEEDVIRNAMENKPIPKDPDLAAKMIPYNNKLPMAAKLQRCKQCVIYNEHQKHKYRLVLPIVIIAYVVLIAGAFNFWMGLMESLILKLNRIVGIATYQKVEAKSAAELVPFSFQIILLVCIALILMTYTLRLIEYLFFKAKI